MRHGQPESLREASQLADLRQQAKEDFFFLMIAWQADKTKEMFELKHLTTYKMNAGCSTGSTGGCTRTPPGMAEAFDNMRR